MRRRGRRGADHEAHALELVEHHHALGPAGIPIGELAWLTPTSAPSTTTTAPTCSSTTTTSTTAPTCSSTSSTTTTSAPPRSSTTTARRGSAGRGPRRAPRGTRDPPPLEVGLGVLEGEHHHHALGELGPLHHLALVVLEGVASLGEDTHAPTLARNRPRPARTIPSGAGSCRFWEVP